jgi:mono/diheme cytochrome c family protein
MFKLVSTTNGIPTDDDLVATLRRGMPGTAMMSWGWLAEEDLRALASEVRRLAVRGYAASLQRTAAIVQEPLTPEQAMAQAGSAFEPGPGVGIGPAATGGDVAVGRTLFLRHCAACHGADGRGLPATVDWRVTDAAWWPRDLTRGVLLGGSSARDLALRIRAGMPGGLMPPTQLSDAETGALVAHVQRLLPADTEQHVQVRRTLRVAAVERLPADDPASALAALEGALLPVVPLWRRAEACDEVRVRAAHDGNELLVCLDWADASRDDRAGLHGVIGDGAAIMFTRETDPPLFAMGTPAEPVNVWRWRTYGPKETAGMLDLLERPRHAGLDVPDVDWRPAPASESVAIHGIESARRETGSGVPLQALARWERGRWTVAMRRSLRTRDAHEVDFRGAGPVLFALAVWDGRIDAHAGSKAITTWHVLEFER